MIPFRLFIFGLTVNSIWIGLTIYLYRRLTAPYDLSKRQRIACFCAGIFVALIVPCAFLTRLMRHVPGQEHLAFLGFATMGCVAVLVTFIVARDLVLLAVTGLRRAFKAPAVDPSKRRFFLQASNAGIAAAAAGVAGAGLQGGQQAPSVERIDLPIKNLHNDLIGLKIVQISDLHLGATSGVEEMKRVADRVQALEPDLIAVTGDLVDGPVEELAEGLAPLLKMSAPLGVHFCTGNHEYYAGWKPWCEHLQAKGWKVLINEHKLLQHGEAKVMVAGIPDRKAPRFEPTHACDLAKTLAGCGSPDLRLLLAHQPRSIAELKPGSFDLMLSGHTHGGQFFPFTLLVHLFQPLVAGLYREKDMWVYVNRGTTHWGPPLRLGARQEITLLTMRREATDPSPQR